jgi:chorismate mutase
MKSNSQGKNKASQSFKKEDKMRISKYRKSGHKGKTLAKKSLNIKREKIDLIDYRLINLLAKRIKVVKDIAVLKKERHMSVFQKQRIAIVLKKRREIAKKYGISPALIEKLYKEIIKECMRIERRVVV